MSAQARTIPARARTLAVQLAALFTTDQEIVGALNDADVDTYAVATSNGDGTFQSLGPGAVFTGPGAFAGVSASRGYEPFTATAL